MLVSGNLRDQLAIIQGVTRLVIKKIGIILTGKSHEPSRWGDDVTARLCWRTLGKIGHALGILKQWIF